MIIPLWNKKTFNFNNLQNGTAETHVAVKSVAADRYTEGQVVVRAHSHDIAGTATIQVVALTTAPSAEEPQMDFVSSTASGTATINSSTSTLATADLSGFGGFLRINVIGNKASGNCTAELSADLILKE